MLVELNVDHGYQLDILFLNPGLQAGCLFFVVTGLTLGATGCSCRSGASLIVEEGRCHDSFITEMNSQQLLKTLDELNASDGIAERSPGAGAMRGGGTRRHVTREALTDQPMKGRRYTSASTGQVKVNIEVTI